MLNISTIIGDTKHWLEKIVIGLNLCPFAKAVYIKKQIRFSVCPAKTIEDLSVFLIEELQILTSTDPLEIDTTLIIHPYVLTDFIEFNDYLEIADQIVDQMELSNEIQIASFHPDYQFAGTAPNDIENYTNRSPYPILHLLREESVERAVKAFPDAGDIFNKNIETLKKLGSDGWSHLIKK